MLFVLEQPLSANKKCNNGTMLFNLFGAAGTFFKKVQLVKTCPTF
jgi:hypothetical protein